MDHGLLLVKFLTYQSEYPQVILKQFLILLRHFQHKILSQLPNQLKLKLLVLQLLKMPLNNLRLFAYTIFTTQESGIPLMIMVTPVQMVKGQRGLLDFLIVLLKFEEILFQILVTVLGLMVMGICVILQIQVLLD